jgi:hypothetical protein
MIAPFALAVTTHRIGSSSGGRASDHPLLTMGESWIDRREPRAINVGDVIELVSGVCDRGALLPSTTVR